MSRDKELLNKITKLKANLFGTDRDDHLEIVDGWEKQAKKALLLENLLEHDGIKIIVENVTQDIKALNHRLQTEKSDTLPEDKRNALIDVRDYMEWFMSLFDTARSDISEIEEEVENNLEDEKEK
jgi:hypothetical protein